MKIRDIMSDKVVTVEPDDSLAEVKQIFENTVFHHLLVVEKSVLVGILSDRDLYKAISPNLQTAAERPQDLATLNKKVHQIMSRHPVTLTLEDKLKDVVRIFDENPFSCIPIVNEKNKPVGIVSWRDLIRALRLKIDA